MDTSLTQIVTNQTQLMFRNVEVTLNSVEESQLDKPGAWAWPLREQIYHLLRSLDQWFINPEKYPGPKLVWPTGAQAKGKPTKAELIAFFESTKRNIYAYLQTLNDSSWTEYPENSKYTRIDLVLGQNRHLMYHIGLIHGCLRTESGGKSPEYLGLKYLDPVVKS